MHEFKVMKKDFKDALTVAKRAIPRNGTTQLVGQGNEMMVIGEDEHNKVFIYVPLLEETESFAIEVSPTPIEKWLDKKDREMSFEIRKGALYSPEKKKDVKIMHLQEAKFYDMRKLNFAQFNNEELFLTSLQEANNMFQKADEFYTEYLKLTDINASMFNPIFLTAYFYDEQFGIIDRFGQDGIAVHKNAIDVLVKTVKKPKEFSFFLYEKAFIVKEQNMVFFMNFKTDVMFPNPRTIKPKKETTQKITINADEINRILKDYKNSEVKKVSFETKNDGELHITPEDSGINAEIIENKVNIPRSVFQNTAIKSFFEGLNGEVDIFIIRFDAKRTTNGYLWMYRDKEKSKMMPGIKEAEGF